jgi:hypothetical protein
MMSRALSTTDFVVRIDECQNCPVLIDMEVQNLSNGFDRDRHARSEQADAQTFPSDQFFFSDL